MFALTRPRVAAFPTRSRANCQLCSSSSSVRGLISLSTNRRVVSAIIRCSGVKSSGVNVSSAVHSSVKNAPPLIICHSITTANFVLFLQLWEQPGTNQPEVEKDSECQSGYHAAQRNPTVVFGNSSNQPDPSQHQNQQTSKDQ